MRKMTEVRKYTGTCGECDTTHTHEVEIKIDRSARISDDLRVTCCEHSLPLEVVSRKVRRPFDRLRSLFEPEPPGRPLSPQEQIERTRDQMLLRHPRRVA